MVVARVLDGRTFATSDGRMVRLAGVLVPSAYEAGADAGTWAFEGEARRFLTDILVGKTVVVAPAPGGDGRDRHGRDVGQVHVLATDGALWVQGALIERGLAVAVPVARATGCHEAALEREARARESKAGVFATPFWRIIDLGSRRAIGGDVDGSFQVMRGVVQRTWRRRDGMIVRVGATRRGGVVVEVLMDGDAYKALTQSEAGRSVVGRAVEVRGWLERRDGDGRTAVSRWSGGARYQVNTIAAGGLRFTDGNAGGAEVSRTGEPQSAEPQGPAQPFPLAGQK